MGNAVKHLRQLVSALPPDMSDVDARAELLEAIDMYVHSNKREREKEKLISLVRRDCLAIPIRLPVC